MKHSAISKTSVGHVGLKTGIVFTRNFRMRYVILVHCVHATISEVDKLG